MRAREVSDAVFLATLGHDETRLLVAPFWISFQYVLRNFPATWSFLPTDRRSLVRLSETHRIGTLVLPVGHPLVRLKREDVLASGFAQVGNRVHRGLRFQLFRER